MNDESRALAFHHDEVNDSGPLSLME